MAPLQERTYDSGELEIDRAETDVLPLSATAPPGKPAPYSVQEAVLADDQVRLRVPFLLTVSGPSLPLIFKSTVGVGARLIVIVCCDQPELADLLS